MDATIENSEEKLRKVNIRFPKRQKEKISFKNNGPYYRIQIENPNRKQVHKTKFYELTINAPKMCLFCGNTEISGRFNKTL